MLAKQFKQLRGFTLVEILITIAIIAILVTIIMATFSQIQRRSRDTQRSSHLQEVAGALQRFYSDNSRYPASNASGQIILSPSNCTAAGGSVLNWGTNSLECGTPSKSYLRQLPKDPLATNPQYCYQAVTVSTTVQRYNLYARMEGKGNLDTEAICGSSRRYNYRITPND